MPSIGYMGSDVAAQREPQVGRPQRNRAKGKAARKARRAHR